MALFFDQEWFDERLAATGSTREDLGRLLGLSVIEVAELWKDQRELRGNDVQAIARFLNVAPGEVSRRAGVSTPVPEEQGELQRRLEAIEARLEQLERSVSQIGTILLRGDLK